MNDKDEATATGAVTKADFHDLKADFRAFETRITNYLKEHFTSKADLAERETRQTKWLFGSIAAAVLIIIAAVGLMLRAFV